MLDLLLDVKFFFAKVKFSTKFDLLSFGQKSRRHPFSQMPRMFIFIRSEFLKKKNFFTLKLRSSLKYE